jgi:SAM-dependent methyltransferase
MADYAFPPQLMNEVVQARELFHSPWYLRHNARRLEHLASLRLPIDGTSVLEVGAGVGDHTTFYLDRGCTVTALEAREANCALLGLNMQAMQDYDEQLSRLTVVVGDAQFLAAAVDGTFDVVHCYGLLYHLQDPEPTLAVMASLCKGLLLLETCVSYGEVEALNPVNESANDPTQAFHGMGCRPTRPWVFSRLKRLFPHVYVPKTQPAHAQFPTDWTTPPPPSPTGRRPLHRAVFIGSRTKLESDMLTDELAMKQGRS